MELRGGTIGGFSWALLHFANSRLLMAAMLRRDRQVVDKYLSKRGNLFTRGYAERDTPGFFQALQAAGAICQDIDAVVILQTIKMPSYGQLTTRPVSAS